MLLPAGNLQPRGDGNLGAGLGERPVRGCAACPSAERRQLLMFLFVRCSGQVNKFRQMWTARCTSAGRAWA
jgi:hypothetical protein